MNTSKVQRHPRQEDKTGRPSFASVTNVNYSTNDPRGNDDKPADDVRKFRFIRVHWKRK